MVKLHYAIFTVCMIIVINSLHYGRKPQLHLDTQSQLDALLKQQSNFQKQINGMIDNLTLVQQKVNKTSNVSEKVLILEQAVTSQRAQIFNLSQSMIPSFNLSKTACQQLTNQQKIGLLDQLTIAKKQLESLKSIADKVPECDQIKVIRSDIAKQELILKSIQSTVFTQCQVSIILSPTIFQSNVYANNWILGNQTIDDLIEQYYQRSMQYPNVTNCPQSHPFFDGKSCIQCTGANNIFNMKTKACDKCPTETNVNVDLRICQQMPHNSNFKDANNWSLDGAPSLPIPDPKISNCSSSTPYYNGKACINCASGTWWSVKDSVCKSCPTGQIFDDNTKSCIKPTGNFLTSLSNSNWVTAPGNFTKVLQERADVLTKNPNMTECGLNTPYWDGVQCINCQKQFDLKTLKCTTAPNGTVYNPNIHAYVPPETNKQTNPKANNTISVSPLTDTAVADCNASFPFYDGKACIICYAPFTLFDVQTKKCVACDPNQVYDPAIRQCKNRQTLLVSTNFNNLMATNKTSVDAYKAQVLNKVQNSGQKIVDKCKDPNEYSDYTKCFKCNTDEFFNVQTKKCQICQGTINPTTRICAPLATLLTDFNTAPNLILPANKTTNDYIADQKKIPGPTAFCAKDKPYAVDAKTCIACTSPTPLFNVSTLTCVRCPAPLVYDNNSRSCVNGPTFYPNMTNQNWTVPDQKSFDQLQNLIKQKKAINGSKQCPAGLQFYNNQTNECQNCPAGQFFNYQSYKCQPCAAPKQIDHNTHKCLPRMAEGKYQTQLSRANLTYGGLSINEHKDNYNNNKTKYPQIQDCPIQTPFYDGFQCIKCRPSMPYFNLVTRLCTYCPFGSIFSDKAHECVDNTGKAVQPQANPEKMFSSIF